MTKKTFEVTVESPYGTQAIEQFKHHLSKVADEAKKRWGITITITEVTDDMETEFE